MSDVIKLKYGNTNTFYISGSAGGLLIDTDYAGTMLAFYRTLKEKGIGSKDISYILATHWHPDHAGLIGELMRQGVKLLLADVQTGFVHFPDVIFEKERLPYIPADETQARVVSCGDSRSFLYGIGIRGEIIHTPSHSEYSVSLVLDDGDCFVGDLEPFEYLEAYEENARLKSDWERISFFHPKRIFYAHMPEKIIS